MWLSAAFAVATALLLIAVIADHYRVFILPTALKPYCGTQICDPGERVPILLFMTVVGAGMHLVLRLVRRHFLPD